MFVIIKLQIFSYFSHFSFKFAGLTFGHAKVFVCLFDVTEFIIFILYLLHSSELEKALILFEN